MADNTFEKKIEAVFRLYKEQGIAYFEKLYPKAILINGHLKAHSKSSVDYVGVYKGRFIAIEAKECEQDIFPMRNIREHQIEYLCNINKNGGLGFLLINMHRWKELFLVYINKDWLDCHWADNHHKSMKPDNFEEKAIKLEQLYDINKALDFYINSFPNRFYNHDLYS